MAYWRGQGHKVIMFLDDGTGVILVMKMQLN